MSIHRPYAASTRGGRMVLWCAVMAVGAAMLGGCSRLPVLAVPPANVAVDDRQIFSIAWLDNDTLVYLTFSATLSDSTPQLWLSDHGTQRSLDLQWDKPCDYPDFGSGEPVDADRIVALVDCDGKGNDDQRLVFIDRQGTAKLAAPVSADTGEVVWHRGHLDGAVLTGRRPCSTILPVADGAVGKWSNAQPPWSLNTMESASVCTFRGPVDAIATGSSPGATFLATPMDQRNKGEDQAEQALYQVDATGATVRQFASGFVQTLGLVDVGAAVVINATYQGTRGLWKVDKSNGTVTRIVKGDFLTIAAGPDGNAVAAVEADGKTTRIVRVDLG